MWTKFYLTENKRKGGRVWLMALVLKTSVPQGTVGSNPTLSAIIKALWYMGITLDCLSGERGSSPRRVAIIRILTSTTPELG